MYQPLVIFLMGPTASGKTKLAIELKQKKLDIDIISVDSALVYRGMNIGTSKPISSELKLAPHRLIDIRDPSECYSVGDFFCDVNIEIEKIISAKRVPLLVGGTMLYFKVLLQGLFCLPKTDQKICDNLQREAKKIGWINMYERLKNIDPISASIIHINDHKRIIRALEIFLSSGKTRTELRLNTHNRLSYRVYQFAVSPSSYELLNKRIKYRFYKMLETGFEDEVSALFSRSDLHLSTTKSSVSCVGYRQMWEYLSGLIDYDYMICKGIYATRRLAKHQLTWLKKWPNLCWLDSDHPSVAVDTILSVLVNNSCDVIDRFQENAMIFDTNNVHYLM